MPIFAYLAVVAPVLFGLLCVAESVMSPPGPMPLTTSATGLPVAYVAPKAMPILTVREGLMAEVPKGSDSKGSESYALSSTSSVPASVAAAAPVQAKTKVAKASKKKASQQQVAQGWQQNQPFGGGWEQNRADNRGGWDQQKRANRNAANRNGSDRNGGGRYAMSGQQTLFSPFGTIR